MEFIHINSEDFRTETIFSAYCSAFPENERRNEQQFQALFKNPKAKIAAVLKDLEMVGYVIYWELTNFIFLEHFEIFPQMRGHNTGSETLQNLSSLHPHIVLESEPDTFGSDAERRLNFYAKNNFSVIDASYTQPGYSAEKQPVPMFLLANWQPENIELVKEEIFGIVYRN